MARSDQGNNLRELVLQPGSNFLVTRRGLDTGTRTWTIDTAYAEEKAPRPGDADLVHKTMYVDEVDMTHGELGVTTITAKYLGLINKKAGKPDDIQKDAGAEEVTTRPRGRQRYVQFFRPIPTVTVTYVREKEENFMEAGAPKVPPLNSAPTQRRMGFEQDFVPEGEHLIFIGWILRSRRVRVAGLGKKGSIYEMTDTYTFETITSPEEL